MVNYYWSRIPGKFVDKTNGADMSTVNGRQICVFRGTAREWYETLIEIMIDVQNTVLRRRGLDSMKFISWRADPVIYPIVECSVLHRPMGEREIGMIGTLDKKGVVCNLPIEPIDYLDGTGVLQLMQFEGSDEQRVLGAVQVMDIGPNAHPIRIPGVP